MPYATLNGADLYYEVHGEGRPIILLPGFDSGSWNFEAQIEALARSLKVVAFDPRGIGLSDDAPRNFDMAAMARDALALLDHLGLRRAAVVGTSMGGFVGLEMALQRPRRVTHLVLVATTAGGADAIIADPTVTDRLRFGANQATTIDGAPEITVHFSDRFIAERPEVVERFLQQRAEFARPGGDFLERLDTAVKFDATGRLDRLSMPTLIMSGTDDEAVPAANSTRLAAAIEGSTLRWFEGGRHMIWIEFADAFNQAVMDFVSGTAQAT